MAYALRPGVSYCQVGEQLIFLDLPADKYLCLTHSAEAAFKRLCREQPSSADDREGFLTSGLVLPSAQARMTPCTPPPVLTGSFAENNPNEVGRMQQFAALSRLAHATISLRWAGLNATISRLAGRKRAAASHQHNQPDPICTLRQTSTAFEACDALLGSKDKCLPRSIAAAHRLLDHGLEPILVLGVRLDPFHAHAWTQFGDRLVNERIEASRPFTPILVV